jgi:hypothetical protein
MGSGILVIWSGRWRAVMESIGGEGKEEEKGSGDQEGEHQDEVGFGKGRGFKSPSKEKKINGWNKVGRWPGWKDVFILYIDPCVPVC